MGPFDEKAKFGLDARWLPRHNAGYEPELAHIKSVLKRRGTQNNLFPLSFYKRVKPPVSPPEVFHHRPEMVAGKKVPFTVALATRGWPRLARLGVIPEGDNKKPSHRDSRNAPSKPCREPRMVRVGRTIKLIP